MCIGRANLQSHEINCPAKRSPSARRSAAAAAKKRATGPTKGNPAQDPSPPASHGQLDITALTLKFAVAFKVCPEADHPKLAQILTADGTVTTDEAITHAADLRVKRSAQHSSQEPSTL